MLSELDQIKKLEEMQQHLIHYSRNALMGEVFASISQQWQQPLAASVLNISVVVNKINELDVGDEVKSFLKQRLSVVQEVLNNKASLVTDFIDFSNPSRMRYRFNLLTSVIASLSLFETTLASHQIKVSYHIDASCELFGIESEFRQVIINIIKNAIDQFASAKIDTPWIHLSAECSDGDVMIEVRDNGGGIADDILPVLFDAYVTTKSDGVGLGLYMVKTIIVEHFGGQIKAFSSDIGTLFSMLIPASMGD
jgi:C4-dicarboxylate-specific signal transduction histidine kinase